MTGHKILPLDGRDEVWRESALCREVDPEIFFPEKGQSTADAKRVCAACDVRVECLEWALGRAERFGVAGGLSERERRGLLKARGRVVPVLGSAA